MDMDMDMDKDKGMNKDNEKDKDRDRDNIYGLGHEKVFIQIKKMGTNWGSEEPECCFYQ